MASTDHGSVDGSTHLFKPEISVLLENSLFVIVSAWASMPFGSRAYWLLKEGA